MASPDNTSRPGATVAQVKDDINSGRTGDKVGGFDPAASPLGTDEEAGGAAYDPQLIAAAREAESAGRPQSAAPNAATPDLQPDAATARPGWIMPILIGAGTALVLAAVLLALL